MDRLDRAFIAALAAITTVYLFLFGYYLGATGLRVPVVDVIYWILHYLDHWLKGDWWGYLWLAHNGHRLVWSRLLMVADLGWTGGNAVPFLIFGIICLVALVGALVLEVMASGIADGPRTVIALLVVLLLATSFNGIDCSVPQLGLYLHTGVFVVLALVLFDGTGEGGRHAKARRIAGLVAAFFAALGVSGGLLIWPVLIWAAWRGGLGLRWIALVSLVGVLVTGAYVVDLDESGVVLAFDPATVLRMIDYVIRFLGLPWSHASSLVYLGRAVGLATLILGAYAVLRFGILAPPRSRLDRIAVGLLLFGFATAAIITIGRVNTAPEREMPIRYALFTSLIQVGLLLVAAPWLARILAGGRRRLAEGVILLGAILFLGQQILAGRAGAMGAAQYTAAYAAAYRDFKAENLPARGADKVGDAASLGRVFAFIQAHGLYRATH